VTHANEVARTIREAFYVAKSGRPGRCWSTSLRTRSKARANSTGKRPSRNCRATGPIYRRSAEYAQALELIHNSKRP